MGNAFKSVSTDIANSGTFYLMDVSMFKEPLFIPECLLTNFACKFGSVFDADSIVLMNSSLSSGLELL